MAGFSGFNAAAGKAIAPLLQDSARCMALLEATDAIVWTIHPEDGFVEEQPSWQAYTGQTWAQARGSGWIEAVHPEDRQTVLRAWTAAARQSQQYHVTCRLWHEESASHRTCVVRASAIRDATGKIVEWVGAVTDVHDRPLSLPEMHRLNDALKHQLESHNQELERLFSVSLDVMLTMSSDGRLITLSPSFETVTGYPVKDGIGEVFARFVHPDDLARTWDEIRRVLTGGHHAIDFETRVLRADGGESLVSWRPVGSAAEARLYAVGRDITEKRDAELRLHRAQKLETVGRLTGGIAHDFNNILAALTSYLEAAKRMQTLSPDRVDALLNSALGVTRRGANLVAQLLTFSKREQLSQQRIGVNAMVQGLEDMIRRTLGGTIDLVVRAGSDIGAVVADPSQLESVLLNLCINARDAMPDGGTLTIATASHPITDDPASRIDDLPKGDFVLISVEDTGTGMDSETLARCTEPFYSTKPAGRGTGLGLSQAMLAAQQAHGSLRIQSKLGVGTVVELVLPSIEGDDGGSTPESVAAAEPPSLRLKTVLLVDDDPAVLASTTQLLEACGYEVIPAAGPKDALAVVLTSRPFDALVTDYAMPGMTGAELVESVRRLRPKSVAVLMTGARDVEQLRRELPQTSILAKPYDSDRLLKAIEAAVATHRLHTGEE